MPLNKELLVHNGCHLRSRYCLTKAQHSNLKSDASSLHLIISKTADSYQHWDFMKRLIFYSSFKFECGFRF